MLTIAKGHRDAHRWVACENWQETVCRRARLYRWSYIDRSFVDVDGTCYTRRKNEVVEDKDGTDQTLVASCFYHQVLTNSEFERRFRNRIMASVSIYYATLSASNVLRAHMHRSGYRLPL